MRPLMLAAALLWLAGTACSLGPSASSSAATTTRTGPTASTALDAEVPMPPGFPTDFPIYPHARLTAAATFASTAQTVWGMEWETTDASTKAEVFYTKQLSQGDWVLTATSHPNGDFTGSFARTSDKRVRGTIAAVRHATVTRILVSLVVPG